MTNSEKRLLLNRFCAENEENGGCLECPFFDIGDVEVCDFDELPDDIINEMYDTAYRTPDPTANPVADAVNHPSHYETGKYECIDVMTEALGVDVVKGFCLGNAFKYIYRCNKKHKSPVEDVNKASWYLTKFIELEKEND